MKKKRRKKSLIGLTSKERDEIGMKWGGFLWQNEGQEVILIYEWRKNGEF
jgi:hypothetical protein